MIVPEKYSVCVRCMTFNQSSYIIDTMDGLCIQQTKDPFICIIVDDASTDGEPDVVKGYLKDHFICDGEGMIKRETDDYFHFLLRHKKNVNCYFAVYFLKYNHWGKKDKNAYFAEYENRASYIAFCEGDDYWTDPKKLQKQTDVLDNNSQVSLVHTSFKTVNEAGETIIRPKYDGFIKKSHSGNILPTLFYSNYIMTLTMMVRKEHFHSQLLRDCPKKYDYAWAFSVAFQGECVFIPDVTGCYRKTEGSSITSRFNEVEKGLYQCYKYFVEKFLEGDCTVHCKASELVKIYRNIYVNLFFHNDYALLRRVLGSRKWSFVLCPEAFLFSMLKKMKRRTYGSIDR